MELIPFSNSIIHGLEPGGSFVGLQGAKLFTWKSNRLDNKGGKLELDNKCSANNLKSSFIYSFT